MQVCAIRRDIGQSMEDDLALLGGPDILDKVLERSDYVSPAQSLGTLAARGCCRAWASRRSPRPARDMPGRPDGGVALEEMLAHLRYLVVATELPVNADFEHGYTDEPDAIADNVTKRSNTMLDLPPMSSRTSKFAALLRRR
jgi:Phosphoenolpyruvate phosphomutase